jgi:hypothetical protein
MPVTSMTAASQTHLCTYVGLLEYAYVAICMLLLLHNSQL